MPFPSISGTIQTGNLLRTLNIVDGRGALAVTTYTAPLTGAVTTVYSLQDAENKGFTEADEPFAHKHIREFYTELGGSLALEVFGYDESMLMKDLVTSTNAEGLIKLLTKKDVNLIAIARKPAADYTPGSGFFDTDVSGAVLASRPLAENLQKKNKPFRILLEGRIADEDADNDFIASDSSNNFIGIVLGDSEAGTNGAAVGVALARAVKYAAHIKLGAGTNGAVTLTNIYIGSQSIDDRLDMETLHDSGLITFYQPPGQAGYYFGVDHMCSKDDLNILVRGRIIDKAQRVIAETMVPYLEGTIRLEDDGTLNGTDVAHIEDTLKAQIDNLMAGQISGRNVVIPNGLDENGKPVQDIINTSTLEIEVEILPLGYMTWIKFKLGLTATL